jgi:hypothetical protein
MSVLAFTNVNAYTIVSEVYCSRERWHSPKSAPLRHSVPRIVECIL